MNNGKSKVGSAATRLWGRHIEFIQKNMLRGTLDEAHQRFYKSRMAVDAKLGRTVSKIKRVYGTFHLAPFILRFIINPTACLHKLSVISPSHQNH